MVSHLEQYTRLDSSHLGICFFAFIPLSSFSYSNLTILCSIFFLDIPVFPTITATVTFQEFRYDEFDESIFTVPDDYKEDPSRFPDL